MTEDRVTEIPEVELQDEALDRTEGGKRLCMGTTGPGSAVTGR